MTLEQRDVKVTIGAPDARTRVGWRQLASATLLLQLTLRRIYRAIVVDVDGEVIARSIDPAQIDLSATG